MQTVLGIFGWFIGGISAAISYFTKRQIENAEDTKVENVALKRELSDVEKAIAARDSVRNNPDGVQSDPYNDDNRPSR